MNDEEKANLDLMDDTPAPEPAPEAAARPAAEPAPEPAAEPDGGGDLPFGLGAGRPALTPVLKVIGVGGGGGNAVNYMIKNRVEGVEFICANTDAQALAGLDEGQTPLQLGASLTKGLGAGADPELGRQAALEDRERIAETLADTDMVFITAGMGGGTGTGAAPVFAEVAREAGVLTVAVVTRPFDFEGSMRARVADEGIELLAQNVDSLITIPNRKLLEVLGEDVSLLDAFKAANDVLLGAVKGISDLILVPGLINVDFADVRTVMMETGMAMMGSGAAKGADRARQAAEAAVRSPLLEDVGLEGAKGVLVNVTASENLPLKEYTEVGETIKEFAAEDATVVVGTAIAPSHEEDIRVTVVATGLNDRRQAGSGKRGAPAVVVDNTPPQQVDYDIPTAERQKRRQQGGIAAAGAADDVDMDFLDIPAFLRRQAD